MTSSAQAIEHAVALACVRDAVDNPAERARLERVIRDLRRSIGVGVPKRRAAQLLGVSVQALQRWIDAGVLPVTHVPGSSRELVDAEALLVLGAEVRRLRESGRRRGLVAKALRDLHAAGRLPKKLRPNESARDLRRAYAATTPADRLRDVAEISYALTVLAAHGARARGRSR